MANQRKDFLQKLSTKLIKENELIKETILFAYKIYK
nr:hypothetical protein [Clostridioides difficile]